VSQYATRAQLAIYGLPARLLTQLSVEDQDAQLEAASAEADDYLRRQYDLPLSSWGVSLSKHVCAIASFNIMAVLGYNPEGEDTIFGRRADLAYKFLNDVSAGRADIGGVDETAAEDEGGPSVWCDEPRGW
jgi:phage gp36-like protein